MNPHAYIESFGSFSTTEEDREMLVSAMHAMPDAMTPKMTGCVGSIMEVPPSMYCSPAASVARPFTIGIYHGFLGCYI